MITSIQLREAASLSPMSAGKFNAAADVIDDLQHALNVSNAAYEDEKDKVEQLKKENGQLEAQRGEVAQMAENLETEFNALKMKWDAIPVETKQAIEDPQTPIEE